MILWEKSEESRSKVDDVFRSKEFGLNFPNDFDHKDWSFQVSSIRAKIYLYLKKQRKEKQRMMIE